MKTEEEYQKEQLLSWAESHNAGREDALTGAPYKPGRVVYKPYRDELSYDPYIAGWVNAICERSIWRRVVHRIGWKLAHWAVRIGPGKTGLNRREIS